MLQSYGPAVLTRFALDEEYGRTVLTYLAQRFGTSMPNPHGGHYVGEIPTGLYGFFCAECHNTIRVSPNAPQSVFVHEFLHHLVHERGYTFPTEESEERWVRSETEKLATELGVSLQPDRASTVVYQISGIINPYQAYTTLYEKQDELGIRIQNLETKGDQLSVSFMPSYIAGYRYSIKPLAPVAMLIAGLLASAGISVTSWYLQEKGWPSWITPVAIIASTSILVLIIWTINKR